MNKLALATALSLAACSGAGGSAPASVPDPGGAPVGAGGAAPASVPDPGGAPVNATPCTSDASAESKILIKISGGLADDPLAGPEAVVLDSRARDKTATISVWLVDQCGARLDGVATYKPYGCEGMAELVPRDEKGERDQTMLIAARGGRGFCSVYVSVADATSGFRITVK